MDQGREVRDITSRGVGFEGVGFGALASGTLAGFGGLAPRVLASARCFEGVTRGFGPKVGFGGDGSLYLLLVDSIGWIPT